MQKVSHKRIVTFDLLRGFFILVIIIDHIQRWPGIFDWFTGQGRLWVSAAEGFILISGIMIGLIRGYKDRSLPLFTVTKKLWKRAFILYIWAAIGSILAFYIYTKWQTNYQPYPPPGLSSFGGDTTWPSVIKQVLGYSGVFGYSGFLGLYAVFLAVSPLAIWLLRKNKWWLIFIISLAVWTLGFNQKNMILSWQLLFFSGSIFGYYYKTLKEWWSTFRYKHIATNTIVALTGVTLIASVLTIFGWSIVESSWSPITKHEFLQYRESIDPFFLREELRPLHLILVGFWFSSILIIFNKYQHKIYKKLGWLLLPFGHHSLFAYIVQSFVVIFISGIFPASDNVILNALIIIFGVAIVWILTTKVKFLHKIIPS